MTSILNIGTKVRGFYYDRSRGLFLIQTDNSAEWNNYTTPGGPLEVGESDQDGLARQVFTDIGIFPLSIEQKPFTIVDETGREDFLVKVYGITLEIPNNAHLPVPHTFKSVNQLYHTRLTKTNKRIINTSEFLNWANMRR
jgi:ADP-ribose pyrophosphatase YjhB (NUDIX family)